MSNRRLAFVVIVVLLASRPVAASHEERDLRQDFQARRAELDRSYRASREHLDCEFRDRRGAILEAKHAILEMPPCEQRVRRLRALERELADLGRDQACAKRELSIAYRADAHGLHSEYIAVLKAWHHQSRRRIEEPVMRVHPAECGCARCRANSRGHDRHVEHLHEHHPQLDWAGLVLNLLANRRGR